jgi:hypothetical protein
MKENIKISVKIVKDCNEIWTGHLPNTRLQHYHYNNLFGPISFRNNTSQMPKLSPYTHICPGVHKSWTPGHVGDWFFMVAPNICGSSVENLHPATFLAPTIMTQCLTPKRCPIHAIQENKQPENVTILVVMWSKNKKFSRRFKLHGVQYTDHKFQNSMVWNAGQNQRKYR